MWPCCGDREENKVWACGGGSQNKKVLGVLDHREENKV